jgi:hypothetical protein
MKRGKKESDKISRREFARRAVLATAASAAGVSPAFLAASAQTLDISAARRDATVEPDAEIEAKVQAILRKYGERLSVEQKTDIRRLVAEGQKPLAAMRGFSLENSDQPANVMKIYPDASAPRRPRGR